MLYRGIKKIFTYVSLWSAYVENDIGLLLMTMDLEKLGKMVAKLGRNNLKNRKIRLQILDNLKIWSRIIFEARNR